MQSQRVSLWFDRDGDMLEVLWSFREGYFVPTEDDRILKRLDNNGDVIGFLVHEFSTLSLDRPEEIILETEPTHPQTTAVTIRNAAEELGVSERRIRQLVGQGRVLGASKAGNEWLIPTPIQVAFGTRGPMGVAHRIAESPAPYNASTSTWPPNTPPLPPGDRNRTPIKPGQKPGKRQTTDAP